MKILRQKSHQLVVLNMPLLNISTIREISRAEALKLLPKILILNTSGYQAQTDPSLGFSYD